MNSAAARARAASATLFATDAAADAAAERVTAANAAAEDAEDRAAAAAARALKERAAAAAWRAHAAARRAIKSCNALMRRHKSYRKSLGSQTIPMQPTLNIDNAHIIALGNRSII